MKNTISILFINTFIVLFFTGCTLMMEDFSIPEEEKGIGEVYTTSSELGKISYQYNDGVLVYNGSNQDYIIIPEEENSIYIMDNIPNELIPKEGSYITANCTEKIPFGLHNKVASVIHAGGMYKVELEAATRKEIFKEFDIKIDFDYAVPNAQIEDSTEILSRSMILRDSVLIDMSLFKGNSMSRAEEKNDTTFSFSYYRQILGYGSLDLNFTSTEHKKFHYLENARDDYKEEWTDSYSERNYVVKLGVGQNPDIACSGLNKCKDPKQWKEFVNAAKECHKLGDWKEKTKPLLAKNIFIPIPNTCITIILDFDASVYFDLRAFGSIKYTSVSETHRTGKIEEDGTVREIDETIKSDKKVSDSFSDIYMGGTFDIYGRVRAGVGFSAGAGKKIGAGLIIGIESKTGLRGACETDFMDLTYDQIDRENLYAEIYQTLSGYGKGMVIIGGKEINLGELNFLTHEKKRRYPINAVVDDKKLQKSYRIVEHQLNPNEAPKKVMEFDIDIAFKSLALTDLFEINPDNECPAIRIYSGKLEDKKYVTIHKNEKLEAGEVYNFIVNAATKGVVEAEEYRVVPCIYNKRTDNVIEFRNNIMIYGAITPNITQPKVVQWYSRDLTEDDLDLWADYFIYGAGKNKSYKDFAEYAFTTTVELKNARLIKNWGFNIRIYNKNDKLLINEDIDYDYGNGVWKSGKYTLTVTFISDIKPAHIFDAMYVITQPYCEFTLEGQESSKKYLNSKAASLQYIYERAGGPYVVGSNTSVLLE